MDPEKRSKKRTQDDGGLAQDLRLGMYPLFPTVFLNLTAPYEQGVG